MQLKDSDDILENHHPANDGLIRSLEKGAARREPTDPSPFFSDDYILRAHPDLQERFFKIFSPSPNLKTGVLFGCPVMMNADGIILAYAIGAGELRFRIPYNHIPRAMEYGGRLTPDSGNSWVSFQAWSQDIADGQWMSTLKEWGAQAVRHGLEMAVDLGHSA